MIFVHFVQSLLLDIPYLLSVHGNGKIGETFPKNSVFTSKKHAELHGSDQFVHNALNLEEYIYHGRSREKLQWKKFAFLAKASLKEENLNHCVKAIKNTRKHLDILGGRVFWPSKYKKRIWPLKGKVFLF